MHEAFIAASLACQYGVRYGWECGAERSFHFAVATKHGQRSACAAEQVLRLSGKLQLQLLIVTLTEKLSIIANTGVFSQGDIAVEEYRALVMALSAREELQPLETVFIAQDAEAQN